MERFVLYYCNIFVVLLEPSIEAAKNGFRVERLLAIRLEQAKDYILKDTNLQRVFARSGNVLKEGDLMIRESLAETLEFIATQGANALYACAEETSVCKRFVKDVKALGGIISEDDMRNYRVKESVPLNTEVELTTGQFLKVVTPGVPSSGVVVSFALNILEHLRFKKLYNNGIPRELQLHYIIETLKHAFAHRMQLGDSMTDDTAIKQMLKKDYASLIGDKIVDDKTFDWSYYLLKQTQSINDQGTTHLSVVDKDLNVVSFTSTVNWNFGAKVMSGSTGIILNNQMNDFTVNMNQTDGFGLPPSKANVVGPFKTPMSSMSPTIIIDKSTGMPKLVLGGLSYFVDSYQYL